METIIDIFDVLSLLSASASIILAVIAIILSILFYRWSEQSNKDSHRLSIEIEYNTKKIETLFDRFYSDTFGLMKNNYEAMQNKFLGLPISSGDSSQTDQEQLETIISSIILKVKICSKDNILQALERMKTIKKYNIDEVNIAINTLEKDGAIFLNENMISIALPSTTVQDSGKM